MNRYEFPFNLQCNTPTAVALGTFDGLHLAHRKVIEQAVASPYKSVVFAIEKTGKQATSLLQSEKKQALLESIGVSLFLAVPLDTICHLSPEEFFNTYLVEALQAKEIICGFNFRFGKDAAGDVALLEKLCKKAEIALQVTPPVTYGGQPISSTRVRAALQEGTPALATALLGRPFSFTATVI
ncbi:MAG: riboflavin biosynthesis protein RibF, partial [Clostridia bacterium]|nr:riboflavin biosynthesis protein RibF [Clostridia bacterium]